MIIHLDGNENDLVTFEGKWSNNCVEHVEGEDAVLSYSDGSVKEAGAFGSGAWYVKGGSMKYSHKEYPGCRDLSSGRVELLYTMRCLVSIQMAGWAGVIHHRLDNLGVVKSAGDWGEASG